MDQLGSPDDESKRVRALTEVISALQHVDDEARRRILASVRTYFGLTDVAQGQVGTQDQRVAPVGAESKAGSFSEDRSISAKEFLLQKRPQTDVERVACLGYYLTHYRDMPRFKTFDISKLNTEAAQFKFSNAAAAVDNAARKGFLTSATQGTKQITAMNEQFVQALPNREAAREAIAGLARRRRSRRPAQKILEAE